MTNIYRAVIKSILTFSLNVWISSTTQNKRAKLSRVVKTASKIIDTDLPSLECLFHERWLKKTRSIIRDDSHPTHELFEMLPSGCATEQVVLKIVSIQPLSKLVMTQTNAKHDPSIPLFIHNAYTVP